MSNINDYIDEYGAKTFSKMPFNEVDALIFSQLSYVDYSAVVGKFDSDSEISLSEAAAVFFSLYDEEKINSETALIYKAIMLLKQCSNSNRYKGIRLLRYVNNVNDRIDKQFSAITFYIDNNTALIAYRGTDTSVTGLKESAMLSYMFPVPAQIQGLYYLQESGTLADRNLIICGHSKGGNLATFSAVNCSNSLKKKIKGIYEFDAPGFNEEFINRRDYVAMKSKMYSYIPQSSVIGCLFYHNTDRKVVKSTNENIRQHQASSWVVDKNSFVYTDERDELSKFIEKYIKKLTVTVGEDNIEELFETIFNFIESTGISDFEEIKTFDIIRFIRTIKSIKSIDDEKKELIEKIIKQALKDFTSLLYTETISEIQSKPRRRK